MKFAQVTMVNFLSKIMSQPKAIYYIIVQIIRCFIYIY